MEVLRVENLKFKYPNSTKYAIYDVSFRVLEGEIILLCGESGCGKTTLLKLLKKELSPVGQQYGNIRLFDGLVQDSSACDVGFIMQNPQAQIVTDKVWHELAFGLENLGLDRDKVRLRTGEISSFFGISSWFEKNTHELSGGQAQVLNLASVMAMQPRLLLLDEPLSQLDPVAAGEFLNAVMRLNREVGTTIIIAEHRLEDVFAFADKVAIMNRGRLPYIGKPDDTAKYIISKKSLPLFKSLPSAARIFAMTGGNGKCPLNVRQGRSYLWDNFSHKSGLGIETQKASINRRRIIKLRGISFRYKRDSVDILKKLDLDVYKGENLCVLGANGVGKSTLLSMLCGVIKPYMGSIKCDKNLRFALLPQQAELVFLRDNLFEDLKYAYEECVYSSEQIEKRIYEISSRFNIFSLLDRHPYDLSGGEVQRAALAKLMIKKPDILLLDEPTKGIDPDGKDRLAGILKELCKCGVTIVTVTHDIEFAAINCDRCALMFNGEIISSGVPNEFFCGNSLYTTAANRISRDIFTNTVTCKQVAAVCTGQEYKNEEDQN